MIISGRTGLVVAVLVTAGLTGCAPMGWGTNLEAGLSRAATERRPALVMFSSMVSPDCISMDKDVFPDPSVQNALRSFVLVRIDYVLHRKLAKELNVQTVPTFVVFRPDRTVAGVQEGKMDAPSFSVFLIKYRYY